MSDTTRPGIPETVTLEFARAWVEPRNSPKRFKHIEGVADVARRIAAAAGEDVFLAELGGWLHDACKEVKDKTLVEMAQGFRLSLHPIEKAHGHLLHGPVAAEVARRELGITHQQLLDSIKEHTLGAAPMSKLSEIVFLADCLEEGRPSDYTDPIWEALDIDGSCNLDAAILKACDLNLQHLMETGRPIHPLTVEVRNLYLERVKAGK
jgi:predicted HD superfamily hydrolase involved in NAD metabolism